MHPFPDHKAGVLLHPTALTSGQLDVEAEHWIDWLAEAGFGVWQVLPMGVPQANHSPYMCLSSFALNPALLAASTLETQAANVDMADFLNWCRVQHYWLEDFSLFMVLKKQHGDLPWYAWPDEYRSRNPDSLAVALDQHQRAVTEIQMQQYLLYKRWQALRDYARSRGIATFGDLPIFVAHDSADVWANQSCFLLNEAGQPQWVAGVPPDYFSTSGQRWGNPHYDWQELEAQDFRYWVQRLGYQLECFDLLRVDHFRGLEAVWMIEAGSEGAIHGHWQRVPGEHLLRRVQEKFGKLPLVAEDLGTITPEVEALRKLFSLPGMAVLQFAWDGAPDNPHLPANIGSDRVVYTGTHDNDTTAGWFNSLSAPLQHQIMQKLEISQAEQITPTLINAALNSAARLAMFPLQDLLGLGSETRMNTPGTDQGNWRWRVSGMPGKALAEHLRQLLTQTGRLADTHG